MFSNFDKDVDGLNLTKLFETQKILDDRIVKEKGLEGHDLLDKKILALQVELGELANEWRGFKFWSEDRQPRYKTTETCTCCDGDGTYLYWNIEPGINRMVECDVCEGKGVIHITPLLEEYVDCLHFILSIGLDMGFSYINFEKEIEEYSKFGVTFKDKTINAQFNNTFYFIALLEDYRGRVNYREMTICFIRLGEMIGFTWNQIEQAYYDKNKINHDRQSEGY